MHRLLFFSFVALAVLAASGLAAPASSRAAATFNVRAGDGEPGYTVNLFLPDKVTILKGDTVHYTFPWKEPHTVTIGEPTGDPTVSSVGGKLAATYDGTGYLSSGFMGDFSFPPGTPKLPQVFDLTFSKAGEYSIFCAIHPLMTSTVKVVESGTVSKQADLDAAAQSTYSTALAGLKTLAAGLNKPAAVTAKPGGGNQYTLTVAGENPSGDVQQYFPPSVNVREGDTVVWKSDNNTPHTVTFGEPRPVDPFEAEPLVPAGGNFAGGAADSAVIGNNFPAGKTFTLTFTKAGTYDYICVLHATQGMVGKVVVAAAPAPPAPTPTPTPAPPPPIAPAPPNTGSGLADGPSSAGWMVLAGLVALAASGAGFALVRRRA